MVDLKAYGIMSTNIDGEPVLYFCSQENMNTLIADLEISRKVQSGECVLCPIEPTDVMCSVGRTHNVGPYYSRPYYIYKAMIAAQTGERE
jgi:hypothetical protein